MQIGRTPIQTDKIGKSRLKKRRDFLRVQRGGYRYKGRFVVFISRINSSATETGRFGLVASKATGKAHTRNKIKRQLRHLISEFPELLLKRDLVLLAVNSSSQASFSELKKDFENAARSMKANPPIPKAQKPKQSSPAIKIMQGELHVQ